MKAVLLAIFAVVALSLAHSNVYYKSNFSKYVSKFEKTYSAQEMRYRLSIFSENLDFINSENTKGNSYTLGYTPFLDMTNEEFGASRSCGCLMKKTTRNLRTVRHLSESNLPESVDWREKGAVNPVKDQASCGSCWAFSAVAAAEGVVAISTGKLLDFSEQQLVDCDGSSNGCNGGLMTYAFEYLIEARGMCSQVDYPYTAQDDSCKDTSCARIGTISAYVEVEANNGNQLLAAIAEHPVSVAVSAGSSVFQHYTSGVLDSSSCGTGLNHGVAAVGYGVEKGKTYLIVRNSWGGSWGDHGYLKIAHTPEGAGICGINQMNCYPIV